MKLTDQGGRYAYAVCVHLVVNIPAGRVVRDDVYINGAINADAKQWFAGRFV
ncbi:hypothetical protein NHH63_21040 [Xanthomonas campestris pv. campestris]|uniref:hypothetical protein n=1 Tax=Xanthomonas campestris TaxID=339 RepID=UPI00265BA672|nr:hypothetical protein [Xanthomonas campestris]MDO0791310.1 hypothetical protein [Xanthomonas campestris pv. campestris]MDO0840196.1 hypothetical protein [Xanthomonas campestris pv. campestris]MDX6083475.1 hypothetical protein [Xanthomonas campestris pv. incanae]